MWNETVSQKDSILHLGDMAFGEGWKVAKKLQGDITLIRGNHDKESHLAYYRSLGWDVVEGVRIGLEGGDEVVEKLHREYGEMAKDPLLCAIVEWVGDRVVLFSHFPVFDENPYDEKFAHVREMLEFLYIECGCDLNIHGHIHSQKAKEPFCVNACVGHTDFAPVLLERLVVGMK